MRDSIPIEKLIRSYMDPTIEEDVEVTEETNIVGEEPIIESNNSNSGIDITEPMPELAPSKTISKTHTHDSDEANSNSEKVSILEELEREKMKTAEAKELESMREILADVQSSDSYPSSEVKFNDDIKVTSLESPYPEEERDSRRGYYEDRDGDGDDDDTSGQSGIQIGENVNLDIGAETIIDGDSVNILDDIQVLS
jgi:hypothetical protein